MNRKEYKAQWAKKNRERCNLANRKWLAANRSAHRAASLKWHKNHLGKHAEAQRRYYQKNKALVISRASQKLRGSVEARLIKALRTRLFKAVRGINKSAPTLQLLGCTVPELHAHLETLFRPGMTWENYGPVWHVDHKRPCASFDLSLAEQQRECFNFMNLQPLFAVENLSKKDRYESTKNTPSPAILGRG